jgi:hypothetical protein
LVREACAAVHEGLARSHQARAWELLQERDAEGNAKGALPYTAQALAEFAAAHDRDPDDVGVVHHLAIAHHAHAWDLELQGDPHAVHAWERALGYWRIVAASGEFWASLEAHFLASDPKADLALLAEVRRDLLEHLLDIHVDFVRHYCESAMPERANAHVELVKRARIPPAVTKRLLDKVFDAMTGAVPEARATQAYASALTTLDRFLVLFPDYLPALRMYAEICKEWVASMSYLDDWDAIRQVSERADPYARRLEAHPGLDDQPLAQTALEELTCELVRRSRDRGESYFAARGSKPLGVAERDAAKAAFELGMTWGRLGCQRSPSGSPRRTLLAACLYGHAASLCEEATEVRDAEIDDRTKVVTALRLFRLAEAAVAEALGYAPGEEQLIQLLETLQNIVLELEAHKSRLALSAPFGDLL